MKFALGTAQFGGKYGVANQKGRVTEDAARLLIKRCEELQWDTLDTAMLYGDCEEVLARANVERWNVVTKIPECPDLNASACWLENELERSLETLGLSSFHAVLLHRPAQILEPGGEHLANALARIKRGGLAKKIGVSVYNFKELDALTRSMQIDLVQAPLNIMDRSMVESGWAKQLADQDIELHVRSIYLQGLLLMAADKRPPFFSRWENVWETWESWLESLGLDPLVACVSYVHEIEEVDRIVVGVDSLEQLNHLASITPVKLPSLPAWPSELTAELLNPGLWKVN